MPAVYFICLAEGHLPSAGMRLTSENANNGLRSGAFGMGNETGPDRHHGLVQVALTWVMASFCIMPQSASLMRTGGHRSIHGILWFFVHMALDWFGMNYLAHIFLARQSDDAMLGALLGDFVKADVTGRFSREIELEIRLHRKIDVFTDSHAVVRQARELFNPATRRFAGILLDVFYDHALSLRWDSYCTMPIDAFIQRFYSGLSARKEELPSKLEIISERMISQDWLGSYRDFENVKFAVGRISQRLSRKGEVMREGLVDLEKNYAEIADGFQLFFPDLIRFAEAEREKLIAA